jgi:peptide/nickel transport system substrate-binding protein
VAPVRPGGSAVIADYEYPQTLDPLTARTDLEARLSALVFAPLWGFDDQLRPYPDLARQVPTPENGGVVAARDGRSMTVDVKLVPGLRWSDGEPITADDVTFTWDALTDPATGAAAPDGAGRLRRMDRRSDTELRWTFDGVYSPYLLLGAGLYVMPAHRLRSVPRSRWSQDDFFQRPDVGSGPFLVSEAAEDHVVFAANPRYADGRNVPGAYPGGAGPFHHAPYLERVVLETQPGRDALLQALRAHGADVAFHLLPDDVHDLQGVSGAAAQVTTGLRDEFLNPNHALNRATGQPPPWLGEPRVLEALDRGIDRSALVRDVVAGQGAPARGLYPRKLASATAGSVVPAGRDLQGARRLLDEAGWKPGPDGVRSRGGRRLQFSLVAICGRTGLDTELDLLRRQWQELAAAVTTGCQPRDAFLDLSARGAFDMTLASNQWAADPGAWSAVGVSGRPGNWNRCQNRALDAAFARVESTLDPAHRRTAAADAEHAWLDYRCTIPLFEWPELRQVSINLRNFAPSPAAGDTWNAADWWLGS